MLLIYYHEIRYIRTSNGKRLQEYYIGLFKFTIFIFSAHNICEFRRYFFETKQNTNKKILAKIKVKDETSWPSWAV